MRARIWVVSGLLWMGLATPALAGDSAALVIGDKLKAGMFLKDAFTMLGVPSKIKVERGSDPGTDSIVIEYPDMGMNLHALNQGNLVEEVEVLPGFKGKFETGIQLGAILNDIVQKYGTPHSYSNSLVRYPDKGLYFILNKSDQKLVGARIFLKNSKLLDQKLSNPTE